MKVLVTGGVGFIGSHIVEQLQEAAEVRVLDNLRSGFQRNLAPLKHDAALRFKFNAIADGRILPGRSNHWCAHNSCRQ